MLLIELKHTNSGQDFLICSQRVCIWDWTNETEDPLCVTDLNPEYGFQVSFYGLTIFKIVYIIEYIHMIISAIMYDFTTCSDLNFFSESYHF